MPGSWKFSAKARRISLHWRQRARSMRFDGHDLLALSERERRRVALSLQSARESAAKTAGELEAARRLIHEFYDAGVDALYFESIYVGYRCYATARRGLRFPFGFGLSYTAGGSAIGWGFQLQQPAVVAGLALLMFAVGLESSVPQMLKVGLASTRVALIGVAIWATVRLLAPASPGRCTSNSCGRA